MSTETLGRYTVLEELGRGGMSVVYRGHDPVLDRTVAIKVLHPHLAQRPEARTRFAREAKAVARLQHANIVEVYDYSPPDSPQAYIVTEFIEGPTLRGFVEAHPIQHAEAAALLMIPLFEALQLAHSQGIVHRDVKPENIMLRLDGSPVLMDFGIAQMIDMESLTATGTMLGSPAHMAPEVVEGERITGATDLFSAGTVLYWLVCGALPFTGPTPAALFRRILESRFDPILQRKPQVGRSFARLIEQCMRRQPSERPASAQAVADQLRAMLSHGGLQQLSVERAAFMRDPEVYQQQLGQRLISPYLSAAQQAYSHQAVGRALDYLDRLLTLDEEHSEARVLLQKIERGQRASQGLRWALLVVGLLTIAGLVLVWLRPSPESDLADAGPLLSATDADPAAAATTRRADAAPALDAAPADAAPALDAAPADAAPLDAAPLDATPADAQRPPASGRPTATRPRPRARPRGEQAQAAAPPNAVPSAPASAPASAAPQVEVIFKGGLVKNFDIEINGQSYGPGWQRETPGQGLRLAPGRYRIRMTNAWCEDHRVFLNITAHSPMQVVPYQCTLRPSVVRIRAAQHLPVYDQTGAQLGLTNQDLSIQMRKLEEKRRLTVVDPAGKVRPITVSLVAGERQELPFEP